MRLLLKTIAQKKGIKKGPRSNLINAPCGIIDLIELPIIDLQQELIGDFDYINFFVRITV